MPRLPSEMPFYMRAADGTITQTRSVVEWGTWYENIEHRRIEYTDFPDGSYVSTVFLGIDHGFGWDRERGPVLFETMLFTKLETPKASVFGGHEFTHDGSNQWRWRTEGEARAGHAAIVAAMHEELGLDALQLASLDHSVEPS